MKPATIYLSFTHECVYAKNKKIRISIKVNGSLQSERNEVAIEQTLKEAIICE
jgi:hypothetical protein